MTVPFDQEAVHGLQSLVVALVGLGLGYVVIDALLGTYLSFIERCGLALAGLFLAVFILQIVHLASGGRLFSDPFLTRLAAALILVGGILWIRRRGTRNDRERPTRRSIVTVAILMGAAILLWGLPVFRLLPLRQAGDLGLHMGWAGQLLVGQSVPTHALAGDIPNSYPWLFHALLAFLARHVAGGTAVHALSVVQLLQVMGHVLAFFALGSVITRRYVGASSAALFGGLSGGFGWLVVRTLDVWKANGGSSVPIYDRYLGDFLLSRPYHMAANNSTAPFPRDYGFALLAGFLILLLLGVRRQSRALFAAAGVTLGLSSLLGAEVLIVGLSVALLAPLLGMRRPLSNLALVVVPALVMWSLWLVPLLINYLALDGFTDLSNKLAYRPPLAIALSWGLVMPLSIYGLIVAVRTARRDEAARVVLLLTIVATLLVITAGAIPELLGSGFAPLGMAHRYWPYVSMAAVLAAVFGVPRLYDALRRVSPKVAAMSAAAAIAVSVPSPLILSLARIRFEPKRSTYLSRAVRGEDRALLNLVKGPMGRQCVLAVPKDLSTETFPFTGYRHVVWTRAKGSTNMHMKWQGVFESTSSRRERFDANEVLTRGAAPRLEWQSLADEYDVDVIVVPTSRIDASAFRGLEIEHPGPEEEQGFSVVRRGECPSG